MTTSTPAPQTYSVWLPVPSARIALVLLLTGALGACASSGARNRAGPERTTVTGTGFGPMQIFTEPGVGSRTIDAESADIWAILPGVYEQLQIPVSHTDPGLKELGNRRYRARRVEGDRMSKYVRCGTSMTGALADEYNLTLSVVTRLTDEPGGKTKVLTTVDAIGRPRATSGNPVRCESAGVLELRVAQLVAERLGVGT